MTKHILLSAVVLALPLLLAACQDNGERARSANSAGDTAVVIPLRDRTGMDTSSRPGNIPPIDTTGRLDPSLRSDTTSGTLEVVGTGAVQGRWKFYDVTASLDERTGGGTTTTVLQFEAHRVSPNANFKFRLVSTTGNIRSGSYSLNAPDADPTIEASWDLDGIHFRHMNGNGVITITSFDGKRMKGSFALSLAPVNPSGPKTPQDVRGTFDQEVVQ